MKIAVQNFANKHIQNCVHFPEENLDTQEEQEAILVNIIPNFGFNMNKQQECSDTKVLSFKHHN